MNQNSNTLLIVGGLIATITTIYSLIKPKPIPTTITTSKPVSSSSISYNVRINNNQCDSKGRALGGELMMLIDVAAGLIAAKHAEGPCLTISLDRVTFLSEVKAGDCLVLSAAVNRSWSTSMEIGVRVMKEIENHEEVYCCHAYLTFVKISPPSQKIKSQVPELIPITTLQRKRYLLAGRRRAHRLSGQNITNSLLVNFREQLLKLEKDLKKERDSPIESSEEKDNLLALQEELMVEAYMRQDIDVRIDGEELVAAIEGFMDEVRIPLEKIKKSAEMRGKGGYRRLTIPSMDPQNVADDRRNLKSNLARNVEIESPIDLSETFAMSAWIVRPEHCKSLSISYFIYSS